MSSLDQFATEKLHTLHSRHEYRDLHDTSRQEGVRIKRQGRELVSFSCNDYLGLATHPTVKEAAIEALRAYGAGSGASRLVTGNHPLYRQLEEKIAAMKATDAALVFGSGYMANIGIIPSILGRHDLVIADKLAHACLLDGIHLSGAHCVRFAHNDADACERLLRTHRKNYRNCLIVTEHVFSMDGDVAPLETLSQLAKHHESWLLVDDAHGLGVRPLPNTPIDLIMGTFSKAAGSYGGYVCTTRAVSDYLRNHARSLMFSTGLPPSTIAASLASLTIMENEPERTKRPLSLAQLFTEQLGLPPAESAIVPVICGESEKALRASLHLKEAGFLVTAIRPPTVKEHTARLRFTFSSAHTEEEVMRLVASVKALKAALA